MDIKHCHTRAGSIRPERVHDCLSKAGPARLRCLPALVLAAALGLLSAILGPEAAPSPAGAVQANGLMLRPVLDPQDSTRPSARPARTQTAPARPITAQSPDVARQAARGLVEASGITGGLIVELGCGTGRRTAALRVNEAFVVLGLDSHPQSVATARRWLYEQGLNGPVSVDTFDGRHLPLVDNVVNLLVADQWGDVSREEVLRVLAFGGVAMIGGRRLEKPRPRSIDDWTHYWHGPDNNAVAQDLRVGPPRHMQWVAGPLWTRHHHADKGTNPAVRAVVSCGGRLFYMADLTPDSDMKVPSRWVLVARDAFSGVRLWQRELGITAFERRLEGVWRTLVAGRQRVYVAFGPDHHLAALDAATGRTVCEYPGTAGFREMALVKDVLLVLDAQGAVVARQAQNGRLLWRFAPEAGETIVPLTLASDGAQVYFKTDARLCCLSLDQGRLRWQVELPRPRVDVRLRWPREKLLVAEGVVLCSYGGNDPRVLDRDRYEYLGSHPRVHEYGGRLGAFDARDGTRLWESAYLPGLESTPGEIYVIDGTVWLGPDFSQPRRLRTGRVIARRDLLPRLWTDGHHYRCYPGKATGHVSGGCVALQRPDLCPAPFLRLLHGNQAVRVLGPGSRALRKSFSRGIPQRCCASRIHRPTTSRIARPAPARAGLGQRGSRLGRSRRVEYRRLAHLAPRRKAQWFHPPRASRATGTLLAATVWFAAYCAGRGPGTGTGG